MFSHVADSMRERCANKIGAMHLRNRVSSMRRPGRRLVAWPRTTMARDTVKYSVLYPAPDHPKCIFVEVPRGEISLRLIDLLDYTEGRIPRLKFDADGEEDEAMLFRVRFLTFVRPTYLTDGDQSTPSRLDSVPSLERPCLSALGSGCASISRTEALSSTSFVTRSLRPFLKIATCMMWTS